MPEYLSPGVYVEEIDTGPKPIEGVSTSTAGMLGVAERGPVNVPILVTSAGEYDRWFGGILPIEEFADAADPDRAHCYLPHAIQGFFTNGGKRAYVVRILPEEAQRAENFLFDRAQPNDASSQLLRRAGQGEGIAATPLLYVLDRSNVTAGDTLRIGDGSRAEYRALANPPFPAAATAIHLPLSAPLLRSHAAGANMLRIGAAGAAIGAATLETAVVAGETAVIINTAVNLAAEALPFLVRLVAGGVTHIAAVREAPANVGANLFRTVLNEALPQPFGAAAATTLTLLTSGGAANRALDVAAAPGDAMAFVVVPPVLPAGDVIEFEPGTANHEVRLRGTLSTLTLNRPLPALAEPGTRLAHVTLADDGAITAKALTATALAGARVVALNDRVGLVVGQVVRLGAGPTEAFNVIVAIPGERGAAPDAGNITLASGLGAEYLTGVVVAPQVAPAFPAGGRQATRTILAAAAGSADLVVAAGQGYAAGDGVQVSTPDGRVSYHRLAVNAAPGNAGQVQLAGALSRTHEMGEPIAERRALLEVQALDAGAWGNRLVLSAEDEPTGLAARARTTLLTPPLQMRVSSLTGIEAGTLLRVGNPGTGSQILLKVRRTDASNASVVLDGPGLNAAALASLGPIGGPLDVASVEFRITVRLLRRPDPAVPSRNTQVIATEIFRHLSLDHRHSRYAPSVIGDINGDLRLEDRRPEGESAYIRVSDTAVNPAATEAIRPGPETLVDPLPTGQTLAARHTLANGDDSLATLTDVTYIGHDDAEPISRTGLHALRNIQQISLVAIPGQASPQLQAELIAHCELMRYRFAVLDGRTPEDSLSDIQAQRQAFDTKYAALYHPWLTVPDPTPDNLAIIRDFPLPPSGHVLGVYARTDEDRGVHKAPANEVVRGVTGLTRRLSKGEHDILNPGPMNINVIRDFRVDGRGIRIWGARCITSDSDHKYVPVRRLLIFLERSIDLGLQWAVFEVNSEPLWARVRRTVANFLTDVWRSGALEGAKVEEAFFVKCDRTTMTQTDIDNGRLICVIGVAPVKPAEFVIIRIGLFTANRDE
ncbi:phage tail sheath subtilisin-like domain-containing protein [Falsiroseomonas sp. E2-1-a4]|uniref:phage tail sheath family protein n=1 Tax=Falsiroseomonas sp. E2-1-a4 TaxID=3239299 RepID=UPI003F3D742D